MPDILNTALTGMLAFQRALQVTSHNISNANTPGYTRQVADFSARVGGGGTGTYVGGGTQVANIRRIYDQLQGEQLRSSTTGFARFESLNMLSGRLDTLLADADTGLNAGFQSFFGSLQDLSNDPSSIAARQAVIGEADSIVARFKTLDKQLAGIDGEVNGRIELAVEDINRLAESIAAINDKIALANNASTPPNDLLDERERLVLELSEYVAVDTIEQDDGTMSVFVGSGQSLVLGARANRLAVTGSEFDMTRATIVYQGSAGDAPFDSSAAGGRLGGLLEFRENVLDPARQAIGQTAITFAAEINAQHRNGMDLRGSLGRDLFGLSPLTVLHSSQNTGAADLTVGITDFGQYNGADYILEYDGAAYSLTRVDTGASVPLSGTGAAGDPLTAEGISIWVNTPPAAGDRLLLRTGQDIAGRLRSVISDPQAVAVAAPTRSSIGQGNIGDASISPATVVDRSAPGFLTTSVIEFTSPTTYSINGAGNFTYNSGTPIVINGSSVTISGDPSTGDQFTIEANYGAAGDNANGLLMGQVQSKGILDGGTISISENYSRLVSSVGTMAHQVQASMEAQGVVLNNAEDAMMSTSGVNLDEEAANMIRYQQAYQAVAQVVAVVSTMFDSLLAATRR